MDFKTSKLRNEPAGKSEAAAFKTKNVLHSPRKKGFNVHHITIVGSIALLLFLILGIFWIVKSLDFSAIIFSFGKTLQSDENNKTNFLVVGIGGEGHEGSSLTDSILIASLDYKDKTVSMLSIPRDFYVISEELGNQKINSIYAYARNKYGDSKGMYYLKNEISEITGLQIQYYAKVDFNGFREIVDSLGGIDIDVEKAIYDTEYPRGETIYYETFKIEAGPQHLDGETALKYARSRHTTSDYDRARRQQQIIFAIQEKALDMKILTDPAKITELYTSVAESIETNLSLQEIIELAKISREINRNTLRPLVINDDPTECGGLIYTPLRDYFGGASVALPAGNNYDYIHLFVDRVFNSMEAISKNEPVQVLNGTKTPGLALETLNVLNRFCVNANYYSNAEDRTLEKTTIYYKTDEDGNPPAILDLVNLFVKGETVEGIPPKYLENEKRKDSAIVVELGKDYLSNRLKDPFNSLKYLAPLKPAVTEPAPESVNQTSSQPPTESSQ